MDKFKKMLFDYFVVLEEEYEPPSINAVSADSYYCLSSSLLYRDFIIRNLNYWSLFLSPFRSKFFFAAIPGKCYRSTAESREDSVYAITTRHSDKR